MKFSQSDTLKFTLRILLLTSIYWTGIHFQLAELPCLVIATSAFNAFPFRLKPATVCLQLAYETFSPVHSVSRPTGDGGSIPITFTVFALICLFGYNIFGSLFCCYCFCFSGLNLDPAFSENYDIFLTHSTDADVFRTIPLQYKLVDIEKGPKEWLLGTTFVNLKCQICRHLLFVGIMTSILNQL